MDAESISTKSINDQKCFNILGTILVLLSTDY